MRTLDTRQIEATAGPVFSPAYLVQLDFSTPIRACTKEVVEWAGNLWYPAGLQVGAITSGQAGSQSVQIQMKNNQFAISTIVLAETASGRRVRVWKLFGEAPYPLDAAVLIFDGSIEDVPDMGSVVTFNCATQNARTTSVPIITIGPPYFNYLPRAGQTIYWGNEIFELQPR